MLSEALKVFSFGNPFFYLKWIFVFICLLNNNRERQNSSFNDNMKQFAVPIGNYIAFEYICNFYSAWMHYEEKLGKNNLEPHNSFMEGIALG